MWIIYLVLFYMIFMQIPIFYISCTMFHTRFAEALREIFTFDQGLKMFIPVIQKLKNQAYEKYSL